MNLEVVVTFVAVGYTVMEDDGSVILGVKRVGDFLVTVKVETIDRLFHYLIIQEHWWYRWPGRG